MIAIRKSISFIVLLTLASTLLSAADAFVGTWRLNAAKSKYSGGPREIKDATLVIEEQGDNYQVTVSGTYADGSPASVKYTIPTRGGAGQVQERGNGMFDAVAVEAHQFDRTRNNVYERRQVRRNAPLSSFEKNEDDEHIQEHEG